MEKSVLVAKKIMNTIIYKGSAIINYKENNQILNKFAFPYVIGFINAVYNFTNINKDNTNLRNPLTTEPVFYTVKRYLGSVSIRWTRNKYFRINCGLSFRQY